jgi:hypothetical protein
VPKTHSKLKANKTKKPLKLLVVLDRLVYNIKTHLKYVLKAKVQPGGHLEYKDMVIYTPYLKSRKNKGLVSVLNIF